MSPQLTLASLILLTSIAQLPGAVSSQRPAVPPPDRGPMGPGGQGRGGPGGPPPELKLVARFDKNGDKRLNDDERQAAREYLASERPAGRRGGGGPPDMAFGGRGGRVTSAPGPRVAPADVKTFSGKPIYDVTTLRTFFLEFKNADWEQELMAFANTDVEIPAALQVDGHHFADVGVHFRGASSFFGVPEGLKHSLNLSLDFVNDKQQLGGARTFNLLNSHDDPTYLRSVLFYQAARDYIPAPKANFARVVINGESWGIYVSAEQFNKDFVNAWFGTTDGARWKVPGSPGARGGLEYLGEDAAPYKRLYQIKSKDDSASWAALIALCRTLNETPADRLEGALAPMLDVDGVLKFLALDTALVNEDGYWVRASDYSLYRDTHGRFHVLPHDANETFGGSEAGRGMGPGGRRGVNPVDQGFTSPGGRLGPLPQGRPSGFPPPDGRGRGPGPGPGRGGAELDPLNGLDDPTKPLRSKLLAVPALRARYLGYVRDVAQKWLDWNTIEPLARQYQALIAADVKADTRKLDTFEAFESGLDRLKTFVERRQAYVLRRLEDR